MLAVLHVLGLLVLCAYLEQGAVAHICHGYTFWPEPALSSKMTKERWGGKESLERAMTLSSEIDAWSDKSLQIY